MDYHATAGDDIINQAALGLPDGTTLYAGAGNDIITVGSSSALGEAGNDTIIGTTPYSSAAYWNSPAGIKLNFATGIALDGFGGIDKLVNLVRVQDSPFDDELIGSERAETFFVDWGNNTVVGGGGFDTVVMYNTRSTDVKVSYDIAHDIFTVVKNLPNGDKGTNTLSGVSSLSFYGPNSDNVTLMRDMYVSDHGFLRARYALAGTNMTGVLQLRTGDFNGDGKLDVLVSRANQADVGNTPAALQVLRLDGSGNLTDQTSAIFSGGAPLVHFVPRIFAADFNNDGLTDIFSPDFGMDLPPYPGGQNSLLLSSKSSGQLVDATSTLPQALRQNHGTSIGDVNKDGFTDLFVNALNESTGHANDLLINDGTGHFISSPQLLPPSMTKAGFDGGNTWSMLRDLNNDGYADMVLGTFDSNTKHSIVLLNDGHGSFASAVPVDLPKSGVNLETVVGIETINLNGDNLPDLVLSVTNGGEHNQFYQVPYLQLLINDGGGHFHDETQSRLPQSTAKAPGAPSDWYLSATPIDMDGDGFADLVVDAPTVASKVLLNDGQGNFRQAWTSPSGVHIVAADVNGDGRPDLIEADSNGFSVLFNQFARPEPLAHVFRAGAGDSTVIGTSAAETIYSGKGNDTIDGGAGLDRMVFAGNRADYTITRTATGFSVSDKLAHDGVDALTNVERLSFADAAVALDTGGSGGQAFRLYQAAFNRAPDAGGLGFQMWAMDSVGFSLVQVAQGFIDSPEFAASYGSLSNSDFVTQLYANVLHRAPDAGGLKFHVDLLNAGTISRAQDLAGFSESPENQAALIGVIGNGFAYIPH